MKRLRLRLRGRSSPLSFRARFKCDLGWAVVSEAKAIAHAVEFQSTLVRQPGLKADRAAAKKLAGPARRR